MSTKIEWTDMVWNPVWGCLHDCSYCYARKFARRMAGRMARKKYPEDHQMYHRARLEKRLRDFLPTQIDSNLDKKFGSKPKRIFVNSMSDLPFWSAGTWHQTFKRIKQNPQHTFQFLTKNPKVYLDIDFPKNCWLGFTAENRDRLIGHQAITVNNYVHFEGKILFLSVEPMQERMWSHYYRRFNWVIVGAETGNRKGRVIPKREWIAEIVQYCQHNRVPVFMKDNLSHIWGEDLIQEFPA